MPKADHVEKGTGEIVAICDSEVIPRRELNDSFDIASNVPQRCGWPSPFVVQFVHKARHADAFVWQAAFDIAAQVWESIGKAKQDPAVSPIDLGRLSRHDCDLVLSSATNVDTLSHTFDPNVVHRYKAILPGYLLVSDCEYKELMMQRRFILPPPNYITDDRILNMRRGSTNALAKVLV